MEANTNSVNEAKDLGTTNADPETERRTMRELDAAVAEKVMGWQWRTEGEYQALLEPNGPHWEEDMGSLNTEWKLYNHNYFCSVPCYSRDIAAAMEVVEKMDGEKWCVWIISQSRKGPKWAVSFETKGDREGSATADSLPEAICRAALKATECLSISDETLLGQAHENRKD